MPFAGGTAITLALSAVRAVIKRQSIKRIIATILRRHSFELATFLGTYGGVFKVFIY